MNPGVLFNLLNLATTKKKQLYGFIALILLLSKTLLSTTIEINTCKNEFHHKLH